ncbi:MAG: hypothetical protein LBR38_05285 [Synergistaceae bacterium]|nr:hypothetical protein [Synergistaceae bacterium]
MNVLPSIKAEWRRFRRGLSRELSRLPFLRRKRYITLPLRPRGHGRSGGRDVLGSLASVAVEAWRFRKAFDRVLTKLSEADGKRCANQLRRFGEKIDEALNCAGLRLVDLEGQPFEPGMAATPLNLEDFAREDEPSLVVEQMLEPVIMGENGLFRMGTVTLRRASSR